MKLYIEFRSKKTGRWQKNGFWKTIFYYKNKHMKKLLFALLLSPLLAFAQKDFDYTVYTTRGTFIYSNKKDTLTDLLLMRKVQKDGNIIKVINLTNTGDGQNFEIEFVGYDIVNKRFVYKIKSETKGFIHINPMLPEIIIDHEPGMRQTFY